MLDDRLYFRQMLSGRDFAVDDPLAAQMVNFVYAIGDRPTGECVLVDPAYDPAELVDIVGADGMRVTGVLGTHYHADHIGGSMMGYEIAGIAGLLERRVVPDPRPGRRGAVGDAGRRVSRSPTSSLTTPATWSRSVRSRSNCVHTPGHTPGSQCFLVAGKLVSGDTLFLDGCGRTDLPGSDQAQMVDSLDRLARVDDDVILYPGHRYSLASSATMAAVKQIELRVRAPARLNPSAPIRISACMAARWWSIVRVEPCRAGR